MTRIGRAPLVEGDSNRSPHRAAFAQRLDPTVRALVEADATHFLHQALSSPCLSAVGRAEGLWLEDLAGRRYLDFHGNNVHHLGHGHPRLIAAIKAQLDELPFAPRRFTNRPAVALARKLADIAPGKLDKVLLAPGGSEAIEMALRLARAVTGPAQDDLVLGQLPRRGLRLCQRRRRGAVPLRPGRTAARRHRARGTVRLLSLPLRLSGPRRPTPARALRHALRELHPLRAREGTGRRGGDRRAGPRRALSAAARLLGRGPPSLRRAWRAPDLR